jgi:hypothetical protein
VKISKVYEAQPFATAFGDHISLISIAGAGPAGENGPKIDTGSVRIARFG